jgi:NAD(P)H-dependent FMN reductase
VVELRASIDAADAVLLCTPEYAGALPGSFKNLLDWTVGGGEMYGKRVAWINASGLPTGAADAHASLRKVLGYLSTEIVEAACAHVPVPRQAVGDDGLIADPLLCARVADALATLAGQSIPAR